MSFDQMLQRFCIFEDTAELRFFLNLELDRVVGLPFFRKLHGAIWAMRVRKRMAARSVYVFMDGLHCLTTIVIVQWCFDDVQMSARPVDSAMTWFSYEVSNMSKLSTFPLLAERRNH